jgi:hypothetical protein
MDEPQATLSTDQREFHLEEFRKLREEVIDGLTKGEDLFKNGVVIAAAVLAWLATERIVLPGAAAGSVMAYGWWVPVATTLCTGVVGAARFLRVQQMGKYLLMLEKTLGSSALGWQEFHFKQRPILAGSYCVSWAVLLGGTLALALRMTN